MKNGRQAAPESLSTLRLPLPLFPYTKDTGWMMQEGQKEAGRTARVVATATVATAAAGAASVSHVDLHMSVGSPYPVRSTSVRTPSYDEDRR